MPPGAGAPGTREKGSAMLWLIVVLLLILAVFGGLFLWKLLWFLLIVALIVAVVQWFSGRRAV